MKLSSSFLMVQDDDKKIKEIDKYTDYMHYDVMDGIFTDNKTICDNILINKHIKSKKDIHLMVEDVIKYVNIYSKINPEFITFHLEVLKEGYIEYIKNKNIKVGIALNPSTDIKDIIPYLDKIDLVLVMSVKAGKGGQDFIDISDKIEFLNKYRKENNLNYLIEVDGGINPSTINKVKKADIVVVGSFITNGNIKERINEIRKNAFTLAELMGVIVILGVLALIVTTAVDKNITNSRYSTCLTQVKTIEEAAKMYVTDYPSKLPTGGSIKIDLEELINKGYLDKDIKSPMTKGNYNTLGAYVEIAGNKSYTYKVYLNKEDECHK